MSHNNFQIKAQQQKVTLNPSMVSSLGGPDYPILRIPVVFNLEPVSYSLNKPVEPFLISSIRGELFIHDDSHKISDSVLHETGHTVRQSGFNTQVNLDFPLDRGRIEAIENLRVGNIDFRLRMKIQFGMLIKVTLSQGEENNQQEFLSDLSTTDTSLDFQVPQSHWVEKILNGFGYNKTYLIEIANFNDLIPDAFEISLNEIRQAEKYMKVGDWDKAVGHCRGALEPFRSEIPKLKETIESQSEFEWIRDTTLKTCDWLKFLWDKTYRLTNKPHHPPMFGHFDRHDAQVIMMVTTAVVAYIGRISGER